MVDRSENILAPVLQFLLTKFSPNVAFGIFVAIVFLFVYLIYGKNRFRQEWKNTPNSRKIYYVAVVLIGIWIAYVLFFRLMIMTAMFDYPLPDSINIMGNWTIGGLEKIGLLK